MKIRISFDKEEYLEVEAYKVELPGYPYIEVYAHNAVLDPDTILEDGWRLTEPITGFFLSGGKTVEEAIENALRKLKDFKCDKALWENKIIKQKGVSAKHLSGKYDTLPRRYNP